ncbi:MAG: glycosyltransferase family 4 protein [Candidatus Acidiferrum sp.]|jgi:glycosyltransferase involved in cell wall biosynthesis
MKIALLMSVASPWSRDVALQLAQARNEVHVIDPRNSESISYIGREEQFQRSAILGLGEFVSAVHPIPYRGTGWYGAVDLAWRLRNVLRRIRADVLSTLYGGTFAAAAYLSMFRPYAVYVVGSDILMGGKLKKRISRRALSAACAVFSNGRYLAEKTQEVAPLARVLPLYIGTDTLKFHAGDRPQSPISIVCTRGFMPIYNNELLIRALSHLPDHLPQHETVFAASGPELEKARSLAGKILTPSQRSRVKFLGGASRDTLAKLLGQAHIYVSVALSDGTSLSLMEALASGAFPVLSNIPANEEWVDAEAKNGLLVPCDDPLELAKALTTAIQNEALRVAASQKNRQLVLGRADLKSNMAVMLQELARSAGKGHPLGEVSAQSHAQAD